MFARSTTVMGDPGSIDAGIAYVRDEVMPVVTGMEGCIGMSMLVNRETGRCIATTSWATEEAMRATEEMVSPHRTRAAEIMGGPQYVDLWELAVMHREHEAGGTGFCRVTWLQTEPGMIDETIDFYKGTVLTRLDQTDGFCSASLLVDRATGRACGTVRFDSAESLAATREMAAGLRAERATIGKAEFTDVAEMELVMAHLRAPELV
ncbi:antibiotic biosynthesis monooxygenase [Marmoricola sp. RAF53]|uniref:antibiotic biosynthesis monooxygenase n=1 Tax=Marmoricola sp. RAF53 TaxID=3233059 RepID=UPI003F99D26C